MNETNCEIPDDWCPDSRTPLYVPGAEYTIHSFFQMSNEFRNRLHAILIVPIDLNDAEIALTHRVGVRRPHLAAQTCPIADDGSHTQRTHFLGCRVAVSTV